MSVFGIFRYFKYRRRYRYRVFKISDIRSVSVYRPRTESRGLVARAHRTSDLYQAHVQVPVPEVQVRVQVQVPRSQVQVQLQVHITPDHVQV